MDAWWSEYEYIASHKLIRGKDLRSWTFLEDYRMTGLWCMLTQPVLGNLGQTLEFRKEKKKTLIGCVIGEWLTNRKGLLAHIAKMKILSNRERTEKRMSRVKLMAPIISEAVHACKGTTLLTRGGKYLVTSGPHPTSLYLVNHSTQAIDCIPFSAKSNEFNKNGWHIPARCFVQATALYQLFPSRSVVASIMSFYGIQDYTEKELKFVLPEEVSSTIDERVIKQHKLKRVTRDHGTIDETKPKATRERKKRKLDNMRSDKEIRQEKQQNYRVAIAELKRLQELGDEVGETAWGIEYHRRWAAHEFEYPCL